MECRASFSISSFQFEVSSLVIKQSVQDSILAFLCHKVNHKVVLSVRYVFKGTQLDFVGEEVLNKVSIAALHSIPKTIFLLGFATNPTVFELV